MLIVVFVLRNVLYSIVHTLMGSCTWASWTMTHLKFGWVGHDTPVGLSAKCPRFSVILACEIKIFATLCDIYVLLTGSWLGCINDMSARPSSEIYFGDVFWSRLFPSFPFPVFPLSSSASKWTMKFNCGIWEVLLTASQRQNDIADTRHVPWF